MSEFNIGKQFSDDPQGRFYEDGQGSGEEFREKHLRKELENLKDDEFLTIILDDNVDGYGSSFLSEGFAGMVKYGYMEKNILLSKLKFSYSDNDFSFYEKKVREYINKSIHNSVEYKPTKPLVF